MVVKLMDTKKFGYYLFLGSGDYEAPIETNNTWVLNWKRKEWNNFLYSAHQKGANTILIYLNGHSLPYPSKKFPNLVDENHSNVINEYFTEILSLAKIKYSFNVIGVITTTGHAGYFSTLHPELAIKIREKNIDIEKLLCSFPKYLRANKDKPKPGYAQIGKGVLCHNNPKVREFAKNLVKDCLNYYKPLDGVAFHPPESIYTCKCQYCDTLFTEQYSENILSADDAIARKFFITTYLDFQKKILEKFLDNTVPSMQKYTFTIPWLFEELMPDIMKYIAQDTTLIDWDYNIDMDRINGISQRISEYKKNGHSIIFMPKNLGLDINSNVKINQQITFAQRQGTDGIIQFVGPHTHNMIFTDFGSLST